MELGNKRLRQKGPEQVWSLQNSLSNRPFVNNTDLKLALTNKARVAVRAEQHMFEGFSDGAWERAQPLYGELMCKFH